MNLVWIILLDLLLLYFIFGHSLVRRFYTRPRRLRAQVRDLEKHFRHLLLKDRDILPRKSIDSLQAAIEELEKTRQSGSVDDLTACLARYEGDCPVVIPVRKNRWLRDHLEVLVVALGLAFGVRALFLQPFKIPTGSMQPTLFGIHFVESEDPVSLNPLTRFFGYLNYTKRYIDVSVRDEGYVDLAGIRPAAPAIPFFPSSIVQVGNASYKLPGDADTVRKYLSQLHGRGAYLQEGEVLARGALMLGDHLFVDRTHLAFSEPERGDVMVFITDGITRQNGDPLAGRYYIKRLVGLPGDTLRISGGRLYVKEKGANDFRLVDEDDDPGFERVYSMMGGYHGYTHHTGASVLTSDSETFRVPAGQYFMLGDNSAFSLDSRFWKTVPRANLIGRAFWVWWPFSRRWGFVDRVEPVSTPTEDHAPRDSGLPPLLE